MTKRTITVAAIQTSYGPDMAANIDKTAAFVREAATSGRSGGAAVGAVPGHLFLHAAGPEVVRDGVSRGGPPVRQGAAEACAASSGVVIPISFFEKDGPRYYNSVAIADADGEILGVYRKSHIPDGPGYQEKYYFRPGDTGFKAWDDQVRTHRRRHLLGPVVPGGRARHGAEGRRDLVLSDRHRHRSPTTPRSTPHKQWQRAMQGHAVSNAVPVVAANRIGLEDQRQRAAEVLRPFLHRRPSRRAGRELRREGRRRADPHVRSSEIESYRADWGFFRDRRTDLYEKSLV